jgi:hypothetical protein
MTELTAQELLRQAMMTAHDYMLRARCDIDEIFGPGFARDNPALVGAYMQTAARDYASGMLDNGIDHLVSAIETLAHALDQQGDE